MENTLKIPFLQRLQTKWKVKSLAQVCLILLTFTLTGTTVVLLRKTLFDVLGFTTETSFWLKTLTYLLFVFPAYQLLILVYGALLGQFAFFWEKEKKLGKAIYRFLVGKKIQS
jgi:hypothetical protein